MITNEKINAVIPLLFQYVIALVISLSINFIIDMVQGSEFQTVSLGELYIGVLNNFTMLASNYALGFVDYPTQALVKSSKILPVMFFGIFRKTYNYKLYKYICAFMITVGLIVFNLAKYGSKIDGLSISAMGMLLLLVSLFFDGLLGTQSDIEKKKRNKPSAFHLMVANNIMGILTSIVIIYGTYLLSGENLMHEITPSNFYSLIIIGVSSTMGQVFIYITIARFDCFLLSVVNTSRKFFSILFSIIWFQHKIGYMHWVGIIIVIGALIVDMIMSELERIQKVKESTKPKKH